MPGRQSRPRKHDVRGFNPLTLTYRGITMELTDYHKILQDRRRVFGGKPVETAEQMKPKAETPEGKRNVILR